MPLTKISAPKHLSSNQVRALAAAVQDGLVKTCNVPPDDLFQLISRFDSEDIIFDPHFGGVSRSKDACVIEVVFLVGRTDDQKRALFRHVAQPVAVQRHHAGFGAGEIGRDNHHDDQRYDQRGGGDMFHVGFLKRLSSRTAAARGYQNRPASADRRQRR